MQHAGLSQATGSGVRALRRKARRGRLRSNRRPALAANRLFEDRDPAPTLDLRSVFKGVLHDHPGVDRAALDGRVFPGGAAEAPALSGLV